MNSLGPGGIPVLFLDEHLVAVDKPAGRLVIPGRAPAGEESLKGELAATFGRLFVVHRLDRGTSGVLVFARTAEAHRGMNLSFDRGQPEKTYLALVKGRPPADFTVDVGIAKGRKGRMRPARPGENTAKAALTRFHVLEAFPARHGVPELALVECRPKTGRTHQIRVHLASAGVPLAVDPDYGDASPLSLEDGTSLTRTPLHASRLALRHPVTGEPLLLEAKLPEDLACLLSALRR